MKQAGFNEFGGGCPSLFYHKGLRLLLTIPTGVFKSAGPEKNIAKILKLLTHLGHVHGVCIGVLHKQHLGQHMAV